MIEESFFVNFRKQRAVKAICLLTAFVFLFNTIAQDVAWAAIPRQARDGPEPGRRAKTPPELTSVGSGDAGSRLNKSGGEAKELNVSAFSLPPELGSVRDAFRGQGTGYRGQVVIHIQDAHCNYAAQKKIADIISYLNADYGINLINLEGGAEGYDLTPFTNIADMPLRERACDYFVKAGLVNGAEYFAVNNPGKISLWGVENVGLYIDNLKVYRNSLANKAEVEEGLKSISLVLSSLEPRIYSKELLELDMKYTQYKAGNLEFKAYIGYLITATRARSMGLGRFANIELLSRTLEAESAIDFRRANNERDILIDRLQKGLPRATLEELVQKTVEFKAEKIPAADYYAYLKAKADTLSIKLDEYPDLSKYIDYISIYDKVDKSRTMDEMASLEDALRESLYRNDTERELSGLSKNLALLKNIFNISLTRDDYAYYLKNEAAFDMRNFTNFIEREAPAYKVSARPNGSVEKIDGYREDISKFYEYSFRRDEAFVENMRLGDRLQVTGNRKSVVVMVTGGFHTENLCELFKKNNIAYVSIMPNFRNADGYDCPYFKLLSGEGWGDIRQMLAPVLKNVMAIPDPLNPRIKDAVKEVELPIRAGEAPKFDFGAVAAPAPAKPGSTAGFTFIDIAMFAAAVSATVLSLVLMPFIGIPALVPSFAVLGTLAGLNMAIKKQLPDKKAAPAVAKIGKPVSEKDMTSIALGKWKGIYRLTSTTKERPFPDIINVTAGKHTYRFSILNDNGIPRVFCISTDGYFRNEYSIDNWIRFGRDIKGAAPIEDMFLSKEHFAIRISSSREGWKYEVIDLGSENGTMVVSERRRGVEVPAVPAALIALHEKSGDKMKTLDEQDRDAPGSFDESQYTVVTDEERLAEGFVSVGHRGPEARENIVFDIRDDENGNPMDPVWRKFRKDAISEMNDKRSVKTNMQKVKFLLNYVREHINTSADAEIVLESLMDLKGKKINIGEFIDRGYGVCRHVAPILQFLLQDAGIRSTLRRGKVNNLGFHVWVKVFIDGEEYLADPRWGDLVLYTDKNRGGRQSIVGLYPQHLPKEAEARSVAEELQSDISSYSSIGVVARPGLPTVNLAAEQTAAAAALAKELFNGLEGAGKISPADIEAIIEDSRALLEHPDYARMHKPLKASKFIRERTEGMSARANIAFLEQLKEELEKLEAGSLATSAEAAPAPADMTPEEQFEKLLADNPDFSDNKEIRKLFEAAKTPEEKTHALKAITGSVAATSAETAVLMVTRPPVTTKIILAPIPEGVTGVAGGVMQPNMQRILKVERERLRTRFAHNTENIIIKFYSGSLDDVGTQIGKLPEGTTLTEKNSVIIIDGEKNPDDAAVKEYLDQNKITTNRITVHLAKPGRPAYFSIGAHVAIGLGVLDALEDGVDERLMNALAALLSRVAENDDLLENIKNAEDLRKLLNSGKFVILLPPAEAIDINEKMSTLLLAEEAAQHSL